MKPSKYAAYCPGCGREDAFPIKQFSGEVCPECGKQLLPVETAQDRKTSPGKENAPLRTVISEQREDLTQEQYNQIGSILQAWGYDKWDIVNAALAVKQVLGAKA